MKWCPCFYEFAADVYLKFDSMGGTEISTRKYKDCVTLVRFKHN